MTPSMVATSARARWQQNHPGALPRPLPPALAAPLLRASSTESFTGVCRLQRLHAAAYRPRLDFT